jgi:hypothetical protein
MDPLGRNRSRMVEALVDRRDGRVVHLADIGQRLRSPPVAPDPRQRRCALADLGRDRICAGSLAAGDDDRVAALGECLGHCAAQPTAAADDQGGLMFWSG